MYIISIVGRYMLSVVHLGIINSVHLMCYQLSSVLYYDNAL